jgi:hypothetical protein
MPKLRLRDILYAVVHLSPVDIIVSKCVEKTTGKQNNWMQPQEWYQYHSCSKRVFKRMAQSHQITVYTLSSYLVFSLQMEVHQVML